MSTTNSSVGAVLHPVPPEAVSIKTEWFLFNKIVELGFDELYKKIAKL